MNKLDLRPLQDDDVVLLKTWLTKPHVVRWFEHPLSWLNEVEKRNGEFCWLNHFIAECAGKSIGFCQYYECRCAGEDWYGNTKIDGTYSIDYMIGEANYLGKGLGKAIINALIGKIRAFKNAARIIVQPDSENKPSCNSLCSCGFVFDEANHIYVLTL